MKEELTSEVIDVALSAASKVVEREINDDDSKNEKAAKANNMRTQLH